MPLPSQRGAKPKQTYGPKSASEMCLNVKVETFSQWEIWSKPVSHSDITLQIYVTPLRQCSNNNKCRFRQNVWHVFTNKKT